MMKLKLLAAAASIAFVAAGVASQAQEPPKHDQRPAAQGAEPKAGGAAGANEQGAPKAAQAEPRRDEMKGGAQGEKPTARTEGERNEMKGGQGAERPRAAEAPGQERKAVQGQNEQRNGAEGKRTAEPNGEKSPAARTGAKEQERNGNRTGANEQERKGERTGAKEQEPNGNRTGANEQERKGERTGAKEQEPNGNRTGANEQERKGERTGANENRGQARVKGNVKMSSEHATRVGESLRREGHRESVKINVRVGARVPETVVVRPLPADVIAIVPEYRGYDYFIDESDEIVFVSPQTHEIVGVIDYEGRAASDDNYTNVRPSRPCPTED